MGDVIKVLKKSRKLDKFKFASISANKSYFEAEYLKCIFKGLAEKLKCSYITNDIFKSLRKFTVINVHLSLRIIIIRMLYFKCINSHKA